MVRAQDTGGGVAVLVRSLEMSATPEAPALARRWLDGMLPLRGLGQVAFDVRLLVTELVTNSVRHAGLASGDQIDLSLELDETRVRVEVRDSGPGFDTAQQARPCDADGGRGLQIVAAIAHRWGLVQRDGAIVWFEIDLDRSAGLPLQGGARTRFGRAPAR